MIPAQYNNQQRSQELSDAHEQNGLGIDSAARVSRVFGLFSSFTVLVQFVVFTSLYNGHPIQFVYSFVLAADIVTAMYLTYNLFFLLLDVNVSKQLVDQMYISADSKKLTLKQFCAARNEIHRRVDLSTWTTNIVIIPCLASMVAMLLILFSRIPALNTSSFVVSLLKEYFFVAVAFYYVAQVNERADGLTVKLSDAEWYPDVESLHSADAQRISVHMSSVSRPISFTLLFKRINWQNVVVSSGGFAISLFISILRNIVMASL